MFVSFENVQFVPVCGIAHRGIADQKMSELGFLGLKDFRIFCLEPGFLQDLQDYQDFFFT